MIYVCTLISAADFYDNVHQPVRHKPNLSTQLQNASSFFPPKVKLSVVKSDKLSPDLQVEVSDMKRFSTSLTVGINKLECLLINIY